MRTLSPYWNAAFGFQCLGRLPWATAAIGFVVTAGALDLVFTLDAITGDGLLEANPFARYVMSFGPFALVCCKVLLMLINAVPLWVWRRRRVSQVGIAISLLIMSLLLVRWAEWFDVKQELGPEGLQQLASNPRWVQL